MQVGFGEKRSIVCFLVARWISINLGQPIAEREKWNGRDKAGSVVQGMAVSPLREHKYTSDGRSSFSMKMIGPGLFKEATTCTTRCNRNTKMRGNDVAEGGPFARHLESFPEANLRFTAENRWLLPRTP